MPRKIAFIDSGIGGLSVLQAFWDYKSSSKILNKNTEIIYLADFFNLPYGGKSGEELQNILINNLTYLNDIEKVDLVILACNSSSAILNKNIQDLFPKMQVISLIHSLEKGFTELKNQKNIQNLIVFSTLATHKTLAYIQVLQNNFKQKTESIISIPCPELVNLIENKIQKTGFQSLIEESANLIKSYLPQDFTIPSNLGIIMGCTHYPIDKQAFAEVFPSAYLIDPADLMAKSLNLNLQESVSIMRFLSTDSEAGIASQEKLICLGKEVWSCVKNFGNKIEFAKIMAKQT